MLRVKKGVIHAVLGVLVSHRFVSVALAFDKPSQMLKLFHPVLGIGGSWMVFTVENKEITKDFVTVDVV